MDITPFSDLKIAPRAVFDRLPASSDAPRFYVPRAGGAYDAVTWGDFASQIRRAALFLAACGLAPGDRAAVYAPNRVEWMSAALAIQAAGGVMVPIYAASTASQAAYVASHCDAKVVFVDTPALLSRVLEAWSGFASARSIVLLDDALDAEAARAALAASGKPAPAAAEVAEKVVSWSRALSLGAARDAADPGEFERRMNAVSLSQPGLMLYTSGTSGEPKGVPLTHENVAVNGLDWLQCNAPILEEGAVDLLWLPMSHIFGFGEACLGNTLGFTTYLCDPMSVLERLPQVKPSVFMSVPSLWEKIAMRAEEEPPRLRSGVEERDGASARLAEITGGNLRFCLSGGAGLKREVKETFHRAGVLIIEGYGLTETSPTLTLNRPDAFRFDSVGKPLPSVELRLAEDGEILARGKSVFGGYHKDDAATREAFTEDGWFKTGDVGRFTEDGFLQIVDRKKDILVTAGGKNVPPANIELRFRDDPAILHVVVYGDGKRYLTAGVWLNPEGVNAKLPGGGARAAVEALVQASIDKVNAELASYETIKRFYIFDEPLTVEGGMLTATLKVRRKKVYERYRDAFEGLYS